MISCVNKQAPEFRKFKQLTGLSESNLELSMAIYQSEHNGNWPESVDEIPGANTEEYFNQEFKLSPYSSTDVSSVLMQTESANMEEAIIKINDVYSDAVTDYTLIQDRVQFERTPLPSKHEFRQTDAKDLSGIEPTFILQQLDKLSKFYGINVNSVTTNELNLLGISDKVPESAQVCAFVLDGNIYVNTDNTTPNAKAHELLHILLGSVKFKYADIYQALIESVQDIENLDDRAQLYSGRTRSDILEEIFVEEYSKYLLGSKSSLSNINPEILYKIDHQVSKMLDVVLMGDNSVEALPTEVRFGQKLSTIGKLVNSSSMVNESLGFMDSAMLHRILGNVKSELMKSGELKEECI